MSAEKKLTADSPCLCYALRQASRAVSRFYDEELRGVGLRTTQYSLLQLLRRSGEVRQRDLAELTLHDETTLTRNLRPLVDAGWVAVRTGEDRRERWFKITAAGIGEGPRSPPRVGAGPASVAGDVTGGDMAGPLGDPPADREAHGGHVVFLSE